MSESLIQTRLPAEQRQAEMVQAVLSLAATQEPASITTSLIAKQIGLSQGAVFRHFPTKQAIWLAVAEWLEKQLLGVVQSAIKPQDNPLENLAAIFQAHVHFVQTHPGVPRFIFHELQQPADSAAKQQVAAMLKQYSQILIGLLQQAKAAGLTPIALNEQQAALLFIGSLQGLVMQSMLASSSISPETAQGTLELYLRAIRTA